MKRRELVVILVSILVIILILTGILVKMSPKERYEREYSKLKDIYMEKLYQGYDLSEAENVAKNAKKAYNMEDYESAMRFLDEAIIALEGAKKATPIMLPVTWTEEEYMNYLIKNSVDPVIPPLTKGQMQLVINDESFKQKSLKGLKVALEYYDEKRDKVAKSALLHVEKGRVFEAIDNITTAITQLRRDINTKKADVDVIYSDYNKFRSSAIQQYQLQQELRKKYLEPRYDAFINKYKPETYHPMKFGVIADSVTDCDEINLLSETGVEFIILYLMYDPWMDQDTETINKIDKAVEQIRRNNKKVCIGLCGVYKWFGPYTIPSLENVGHGKVDFDTWSRTYLEMAETLVKRYDPDYVAISIEAQVVQAGQINEIRPPSDWIEITRVVADKVKEISSDTIVIVPTITRQEPPDLEFLEGIMDLKNVDIVGLDFYDGLYDTFQSVDTLLSYRNKEKEFWISETWDDMTGKYMDNLADKYIIASIYYAQNKNLRGYSLYFGRNLHTKDFEKTPAFYTYKEVIEEVRNNTKS